MILLCFVALGFGGEIEEGGEFVDGLGERLAGRDERLGRCHCVEYLSERLLRCGERLLRGHRGGRCGFVFGFEGEVEFVVCKIGKG